MKPHISAQGEKEDRKKTNMKERSSRVDYFQAFTPSSERSDMATAAGYKMRVPWV